jgi:hypothetical protein
MVLRVLEQGWSIQAAAAAAETSSRTCGKWVARYRAEGECGLLDRSCAPLIVANRTDERTVEVIAALRRLRFTGPEIAELLDRPLSTISGILARIGMGRLGRLGMEPAQRYERARPGELIHVDVKKLGRIVGGAGKRVRGGGNHYTGSYTDAAGRVRRKAGWECVHIAIDDATRLAYAEVLPDEKALTAIAFLRRAIAFFERHGMTVEELITDNGAPYISTVHTTRSTAQAKNPPQPLTPAERLVLGPAHAAQAVLEVGRVLDDLREPHDGDRVLEAHLAAVDLLEEVHELLRAAELRVVVLDVARRELLDPLDIHAVEHGVEELLARGVLVADRHQHNLVLAVLVPLVAEPDRGRLAATLHLIGEDRGVEVEHLHGRAH